MVMVYAGTGCIETLLYLEDGLVTRFERLFLDVFPLSAARMYIFFRSIDAGTGEYCN